jgi:hypothetical protein
MGAFSTLAVKLLPTMLFVMWQTTFISIGIYVMVEDHSLKSQKLCEDFHVWRYICFNVVFAFLLGISYFLFPGAAKEHEPERWSAW